MAAVAKALGDPIRLQLVDVLRKHAGKVCVCELAPAVRHHPADGAHHLKKLREAGIVDSERQGLWAYYFVVPDAMEELGAWLDQARPALALTLRSRSEATRPRRTLPRPVPADRCRRRSRAARAPPRAASPSPASAATTERTCS